MKNSHKLHSCHYLLWLTLLVCSCGTGQRETAGSGLTDPNQAFFDKAYKVEASLKGKTLNNLNRLLASQVSDESNPNRLILYYSPYDCSTCVHKGFDFINELEIQSNNIIHPIKSGKRPKFDGLNIEYEGRVLLDSTEAVHEELGLVQTPILIKYSIEKGVEKMYLIPTFEEYGHLAKFREALTSQ